MWNAHANARNRPPGKKRGAPFGRAKLATSAAARRAISGIPVECLYLNLGLPRERPLAVLRSLRIRQYSRRRAPRERPFSWQRMRVPSANRPSCSGIVGMAAAHAARGFKSDSSKRPRELNLRCIDSLRAIHRPREADPSRNGRDDDAAPDSAGRVPTGLSGCHAHGPHFISNGCPRRDARHHARGRSKSNGRYRRRPFGRCVAAAARCTAARDRVRVARPRFGAPSDERTAASQARSRPHRVVRACRAARVPAAGTVARMRRLPQAATGFRAHVASGPAPRDPHHPIRVAALAERARAA